MSQIKPRPWLRYGAKLTDWGLVLGFLWLIPVTRSWPGTYEGLIGSVVGLIVLEAVTMRLWGTTPGKALYSIQLDWVKRPSWQQVSTRALMSGVLGLGLGWWAVQLISFPLAYWDLKSKGQSLWDRQVGCVSRHEKLGIGQIVVIGLTHVVALWIIWVMALRILEQIGLELVR